MTIPYARHYLNGKDAAAVAEVLFSTRITQGEMVPKFERKIAEYCGAKYAVAVNSGTSALHLACLALGLGVGDQLWTSPLTFVASANCARYCGAQVDFVDIDPDTGCMSVEDLKDKLGRSEVIPKVVVPVHYAGQSCRMEEIWGLAQEYKFLIVEDACHALGGRYQGNPVGSCKYSDMAVFSFHPSKTITTGEGGMVVTNDLRFARKTMMLRSHGITQGGKLDEPWYYEQHQLGYNYRMNDIQSALGVSQANRIDRFVELRANIKNRYEESLADVPIILPSIRPESVSSWHLYPVRTDQRNRVFHSLVSKGIAPQVHYIPVHTQPYYQRLGFRWGDFPQAERYYQQEISLPIYPYLQWEDQDIVITAIKEALNG